MPIQGAASRVSPPVSAATPSTYQNTVSSCARQTVRAWISAGPVPRPLKASTTMPVDSASEAIPIWFLVSSSSIARVVSRSTILAIASIGHSR